jgi:hypothetical protein
MQRQEQMIILPTLKYGDDAYGDTKEWLEGTLAVCQTKNVLHEAGISTLAEKESKTQQE